MARVRLSRLRTGATQWGLFRDGETPRQFVELYAVPSWDEQEAQAFSDSPEQTSPLIAVDVADYDL